MENQFTDVVEAATYFIANHAVYPERIEEDVLKFITETRLPWGWSKNLQIEILKQQLRITDTHEIEYYNLPGSGKTVTYHTVTQTQSGKKIKNMKKIAKIELTINLRKCVLTSLKEIEQEEKFLSDMTREILQIRNFIGFLEDERLQPYHKVSDPEKAMQFWFNTFFNANVVKDYLTVEELPDGKRIYRYKKLLTIYEETVNEKETVTYE